MPVKSAIFTELTERGFIIGSFIDQMGQPCSIQESSAATEQCIWLGLLKGMHTEKGECYARMHLTQEQAGQLIPLLQHFVETGSLPAKKPRKRAGRKNGSE
jgi:hypothetical protein